MPLAVKRISDPTSAAEPVPLAAVLLNRSAVVDAAPNAGFANNAKTAAAALASSAAWRSVALWLCDEAGAFALPFGVAADPDAGDAAGLAADWFCPASWDELCGAALDGVAIVELLATVPLAEGCGPAGAGFPPADALSDAALLPLEDWLVVEPLGADEACAGVDPPSAELLPAVLPPDEDGGGADALPVEDALCGE